MENVLLNTSAVSFLSETVRLSDLQVDITEVESDSNI